MAVIIYQHLLSLLLNKISNQTCHLNIFTSQIAFNYYIVICVNEFFIFLRIKAKIMLKNKVGFIKYIISIIFGVGYILTSSYSYGNSSGGWEVKQFKSADGQFLPYCTLSKNYGDLTLAIAKNEHGMANIAVEATNKILKDSNGIKINATIKTDTSQKEIVITPITSNAFMIKLNRQNEVDNLLKNIINMQISSAYLTQDILFQINNISQATSVLNNCILALKEDSSLSLTSNNTSGDSELLGELAQKEKEIQKLRQTLEIQQKQLENAPLYKQAASSGNFKRVNIAHLDREMLKKQEDLERQAKNLTQQQEWMEKETLRLKKIEGISDKTKKLLEAERRIYELEQEYRHVQQKLQQQQQKTAAPKKNWGLSKVKEVIWNKNKPTPTPIPTKNAGEVVTFPKSLRENSKPSNIDTIVISSNGVPNVSSQKTAKIENMYSRFAPAAAPTQVQKKQMAKKPFKVSKTYVIGDTSPTKISPLPNNNNTRPPFLTDKTYVIGGNTVGKQEKSSVKPIKLIPPKMNQHDLVQNSPVNRRFTRNTTIAESDWPIAASKNSKKIRLKPPVALKAQTIVPKIDDSAKLKHLAFKDVEENLPLPEENINALPKPMALAATKQATKKQKDEEKQEISPYESLLNDVINVHKAIAQ